MDCKLLLLCVIDNTVFGESEIAVPAKLLTGQSDNSVTSKEPISPAGAKESLTFPNADRSRSVDHKQTLHTGRCLRYVPR